MSLLQMILPASAKEYVRRKSGVPDMFYSLERLQLLGFNPKQIVDVGAYEGQWTKSCLKIFPTASYLLAEAMPQKAPKLQNLTIAHPNVQFEIALLAEKDGMELTFTELETASSVLEEIVNEHERVKRVSKSLNTILREKGVGQVDLIKLDVQGYELEILKGYSDYMQSTEVVLTEASLLDIHKGTPLVREVINFMYDRGFVIYDICSVSTRRPLDKALWQTDLMFVKEKSNFRSDKRYNA